MNDSVLDDLRLTAQYLETALAEKSFRPIDPPEDALWYVWNLFRKSKMEMERTIQLKSHGLSVHEWSCDRLLVVLRNMYHVAPEKETPLSFPAVWGFLNRLGQKPPVVMDLEDLEIGNELQRVLGKLQNEDFVANVIFATLGLYFGS